MADCPAQFAPGSITLIPPPIVPWRAGGYYGADEPDGLITGSIVLLAVTDGSIVAAQVVDGDPQTGDVDWSTVEWYAAP